MSPERLLDVLEQAGADAPVYAFEREEDDGWLLIKIVLSSRTKDEQTMRALECLKRIFKDWRRIRADERLERCLYGVGFYRTKARVLPKLVDAIKKGVPYEREALMKLPGVGPKTSAVFLAARGRAAIGVDTHVHRIANRMGLVQTKTPSQTEEALKQIFPRRLWHRVNRAFVGFGQTICKPVRPRCEECPLRAFCPAARPR